MASVVSSLSESDVLATQNLAKKFNELDNGKDRAVVVVEDNKMIRMSINNALKYLVNCRLYFVGDGENAARALRGKIFERIIPRQLNRGGSFNFTKEEKGNFVNDPKISIKCVIMDIILPDKNGDIVTKEYRDECDEDNGLPIIAFTSEPEARTDEGKERLKEKFGFTKVLNKSETQELKELVRSYVKPEEEKEIQSQAS